MQITFILNFFVEKGEIIKSPPKSRLTPCCWTSCGAPRLLVPGKSVKARLRDRQLRPDRLVITVFLDEKPVLSCSVLAAPCLRQGRGIPLCQRCRLHEPCPRALTAEWLDGATQGLFAVESAVNELADKLGIDPFVIRQRNIVHEGDVMPAYYGQVGTSCAGPLPAGRA